MAFVWSNRGTTPFPLSPSGSPSPAPPIFRLLLSPFLSSSPAPYYSSTSALFQYPLAPISSPLLGTAPSPLHFSAPALFDPRRPPARGPSFDAPPNEGPLFGLAYRAEQNDLCLVKQRHHPLPPPSVSSSAPSPSPSPTPTPPPSVSRLLLSPFPSSFPSPSYSSTSALFQYPLAPISSSLLGLLSTSRHRLSPTLGAPQPPFGPV